MQTESSFVHYKLRKIDMQRLFIDCHFEGRFGSTVLEKHKLLYKLSTTARKTQRSQPITNKYWYVLLNTYWSEAVET